MHKTQSRGELPSIDVHLLIQEHKVHLEEDEHQLETGAKEPEEQHILLLIRWLLILYTMCGKPGHSHCMFVIFKYLAQLHTSVDQTANAKYCKG